MLWFVVNTDLTITTEKLMDLFAAIRDEDVDDIGLWLYLPVSKGKEFNRNYQNPIKKREAYLDFYASDHCCPSWGRVAEALRGVGLDHQADVVERTYVQGTDSLVSAHVVIVTGCMALLDMVGLT